MSDSNNPDADRTWPVPTSAYLHVPFCRHRCGYCDFSVIAGRDDLASRYVDAIDTELRDLNQPAIQTLFIGGGTPTHLDRPLLDRFLTVVKKRLDCASLVEFTVEANPEDIDPATVRLLAGHGVNRISLGVQSFQPGKLLLLERGHNARAAVDAVETCAAVIDNVSIDLIFATPKETLDDWLLDLDMALSLPIVHLSTYALTIEKGTSFWGRQQRGSMVRAEDDLELQMYQSARSRCRDHGWQHYEISNFASADRRCRHNLAYWQGHGWFAAGPGAASFCNGVRRVNHRSTTTYLKRIESGKSPAQQSDSISHVQYARERLAFGIRMIDGADIQAISAETGVDIQQVCANSLAQMQRDDLIHRDGPHVRLTPRGILFADTVASEFLSE